MIRVCIICGKELIGRQRLLCFDRGCHKKHKKSRDHKWYRNNQKIIKERSREYRRNNSEKINEYQHSYYQINQEAIKEHSRKYYWSNPEIRKEYIQNNRETIKKNRQKDYRRSRGLPEDADLRKESSIERIMREWLQKNNIEFIAQYYINLEGSTYTKVDFYISKSNVCLYVDGGYHHLLPDIKKRDESQNRILPQMGYKVVRMSETEILAGNRPWKWIK